MTLYFVHRPANGISINEERECLLTSEGGLMLFNDMEDAHQLMFDNGYSTSDYVVEEYQDRGVATGVS